MKKIPMGSEHFDRIKKENLTVKINKEWIITKDNELKFNINFIYLSDEPKIEIIKKDKDNGKYRQN